MRYQLGHDTACGRGTILQNMCYSLEWQRRLWDVSSVYMGAGTKEWKLEVDRQTHHRFQWWTLGIVLLIASTLGLSGCRGPVYKSENTSTTGNSKVPAVLSLQLLLGHFVLLLLVDQQVQNRVPILGLIIDPDHYEEVGYCYIMGAEWSLFGNQLIYLGHHLVLPCSVLTMKGQIQQPQTW